MCADYDTHSIIIDLCCAFYQGIEEYFMSISKVVFHMLKLSDVSIS